MDDLSGTFTADFESARAKSYVWGASATAAGYPEVRDEDRDAAVGGLSGGLALWMAGAPEAVIGRVVRHARSRASYDDAIGVITVALMALGIFHGSPRYWEIEEARVGFLRDIIAGDRGVRAAVLS